MKEEINEIRKDFPILSQKIKNRPLIYFDSAATTLIPSSVVEAMSEFYLSSTSNVHRGAHYLSDQATEKYEQVREKVRDFIHARRSEEIVFTSGTTSSIHLVARCYDLRSDQEVLLTEMEHHSNIVPWQLAAQEKGFKIKVIPVNSKGELDLKAFSSLLSEKTALVSLVWVSNVLGTVNPIEDVIKQTHKVGAKVLIDGAQGVGSLQVDVKALDCDFFAFSSHKMFGPFGVGVLYGKKELLDTMKPYSGGGGSIDTVNFEKTKFLPSPYKFEPGTPPIAGVIGLGRAIEYIHSIGFQKILDIEQFLTRRSLELLSSLSDLKFIGESNTKFNISSFILKEKHSLDVGTILDQRGIAIRTGHHCAEPLIHRFKAEQGGVIRLSFSIYNKEEELEYFRESLVKARDLLS